MEQEVLSNLKEHIEKVLDILKSDLGTIRTGRATPQLIENLVIPVYGGSTKLKLIELATIGVSDVHSLILTPFDASIMGEIQKGIELSNLGFSVSIDGHVIRVSIPPLSQERREDLIKAMRHKLENGRIMVRQVRHESMEKIKKEFEGREDDIMRTEKEVQRMIDETMEKIEDWGKQKEQELLQV